jgi:hypothetical protein
MPVKYCLHLSKETSMERNKCLYSRIILKSILGKWVLETRKQQSLFSIQLDIKIGFVCSISK